MPETVMTQTATPATPAPATMTNAPIASVKPAEVKSNVPASAGDTQKKDDLTKVIEDANAKLAEDKKKFKLVIDGNEEEVEEAELIKRAQMATSANKKYQEAAKIRKQSEQLINMLKTDPWRVLAHPSLGHDLRKIAEEFVYQRIQEDKMTPEQRELMEVKEKLRVKEETEQVQKDAEVEKQNATLRAHYEDEYTKDILDTLKVSGLPQTARTVKQMAYYMYQGLERGVEMRAADVVKMVEEDYKKDIQEFIAPLDGDRLSNFLSEDLLKKIRGIDMARLKKPGQVISAKEQATGTSPTSSTKKITIEEWRERNRRMLAEPD